MKHIFLLHIAIFCSILQNIFAQNVIIPMEGRVTNMSISDRYIYRNDVDTAYALVVGNYYTQEEVEKALGKANQIEDQIKYFGENKEFGDGNIVYTYDSLYINIDYIYGLCEFLIKGRNTTFSFSDIELKIGISFLELEEKYPDPVVCEEFGTRSIDENGHMRDIGVKINFSGEDDWLFFGLKIDNNNGIDLLYESIQYIQNN